MSKNKIFTIGHSNHEPNQFNLLLHKHSINCIVDVRSTPRSKLHPQFNKEILIRSLKESGVIYIHFAQEFGARRSEKVLLNENGQVDFEKVRKSENFRCGVERLKDGINKKYIIALMCAEADPLDCHRFSLISYQLVKEGLDVYHILKKGALITNNELEHKLVQWYRDKLQIPLFNQNEYLEDYEQNLVKAYIKKNQEIGYFPSTNHLSATINNSETV